MELCGGTIEGGGMAAEAALVSSVSEDCGCCAGGKW